MFRTHLNTSFIFAVILLAACSGGESNTPSASNSAAAPVIIGSQVALPSAGATWIFQQSVTQGPPPLGGQVGDLTITFQGMTAYRGGTYYTLLASSSIVGPPAVTSFFTADSGGQLEFADALFNFPIVPGCTQSPQAELVLAQPVGFTVVGSPAISESSIRCGSPTILSASSLTVTDGGTATISTPGGTFGAIVRQGSFASFGAHVDYVDYLAGGTVVDRECHFFDQNNNLMAVTSVKYKSGPLSVMFPGPPMLFAQFY